MTRVFTEAQKAKRRENTRRWKRLHPRDPATIKRKFLFTRSSVSTLAERLWARVERRNPSECWPWKGHTNQHGHGRFTFKGVGYWAHRVAYELENGPIPEGLLACHHCDNPPCCNPAHLYAGTHKDNSRDMVVRGRRHKKAK